MSNINRMRDRAEVLSALNLTYKLTDKGDLMLNCLLEFMRKSPEHLEFIFDSMILGASIDAFPFLLKEDDDDELHKLALLWKESKNRTEIIVEYKRNKKW